MASTANQQQSFPTVPPHLSAGDYEMRDSYATQETPRPPLNQTPYLKPYLGLRARLSQIWINRWTILLLLVLIRLLFAIASTDASLASARREALSACTQVESIGSSMASMPHFMAEGVNEMTSSGVEKAVNGLMKMLELSVTGVEEIVIFVIHMMTGTYLCLITLAVSGSLHAAVEIGEAVSKNLNETIEDVTNGIGDATKKVTDGINSILDKINFPFGPDFDKPTINLDEQINKLKSLEAPPEMQEGLQKLNQSIPTFEDVQNFTDNLIRLPFEEVKKLIQGMNNFTFDRDLLPIPQKQQLNFCSEGNSINNFFDDLIVMAYSAKKIALGVLIALAILAIVPMAYMEIRRHRRTEERAQLFNDVYHLTRMSPQDKPEHEPDDANDDPERNARPFRPPAAAPPLVVVVDDERKQSVAGWDPLVADAIRQQQQLEMAQLDEERSRSLRRSSAHHGRRWRGETAAAGFAGILPRWIARHLTFYRLHLSYFVLISLLGTICLRIFPKNGRGLTFIDCMYNAVSASCTTGLISVRMRSFSIADDVLLMFLMTIGSTIFTALIPLFYRRFQFLRNIKQLEDTIWRSRPARRRIHPEQESAFHNRRSPNQEEQESSRGNARRQAALDEMRLEADAGEVLIWVVCVYFFVWTAAGFFVLEAFFLSSSSAMAVLPQSGVHHSFFSLFLSISTITNSGIVLLDDNMVPLRTHSFLLLWLSFIILIGNTMFAPCLRLILWALRRLYLGSARRRVFDFLLNNPRRAFTHLFRRNETLWLVVTVMGFNACESAAFYILSWNSASLAGLNAWRKVVNGIFQSVTTRSAGLNVVAIGSLSAPMLVLYIGMMYIAVYPVYLTRRSSQQQRGDNTESKASLFDEREASKISVQSRKLLMRDSAYLFFSIFALCVIENKRIQSDPLNFSIFNLIFEVISAYGNVGLSVGYSCSLYRQASQDRSTSTCVDVPYSFSGTWSVGGKLLMIVIMLLGRNRGLPDNMDMAVQIPRGFEQGEEDEVEEVSEEEADESPTDDAADKCHDAVVVDVVDTAQRTSISTECAG